ncbi:hypothetical protein OU787_28500 [Kitasatospora sp. YST-16]|uniref:hypothetical protein n=1 Tax=Kitasatospora sp. YST-16 TaxID=2998080 RepID=UPI0022849366|nr:hypothetical protein [Kitasatospora sp. YST-16]WAL75115.1 hypothetical protein OU787_28500 [Kitasatospora sp. YST-16]WNW41173.1 hypothetical protein RKE32_28425 [Streptomyces sp. Li-HN-5-13]
MGRTVVVAARLVTTIAAPLDPASSEAPRVLHWPGRRLLVQRGDTEVVALDLDACLAGRASEVRFPAPWPRRFGTVAVSPGRDAAVFAGVHAVRSVEASGATRWEVRHGCWYGGCSLAHSSFDEYALDEDHRYADSGSVAVGADGGLVWAHVRAPLGGDAGAEGDQELWAVLDAADGRVLGRVDTMTAASGSEHTPHPDPTRMGLSVGEGEEGSPALWGRWDGQRLTAVQIGTELVLLAVSPSGGHLLTVDVGQWSLSLHRAEDGSLLRELDARDAVPPHPRSTGEGRVYWDCDAAFVDQDTIVAGTSECAARYGAARHWLVDARGTALRGEVSYPFPVSGPVRSAGDGAWYTVSEDRTSVHLWKPAGEN